MQVYENEIFIMVCNISQTETLMRFTDCYLSEFKTE